MNARLIQIIGVVLITMALAGCAAPLYREAPVKATTPCDCQKKLSLDRLPASGYIDLDPVNDVELDRLGLGAPSPINNPTEQPFNKYGLYWSEPFNISGGDILKVSVSSDTPMSWFGVDWSVLKIRGIIATTELDEDGRTFDPQYPESSRQEQSGNGYTLVTNYTFDDDTQCVLVIKNTSEDTPWHVSVNVTASGSIFQKLFRNLPFIRKSTKPDYD